MRCQTIEVLMQAWNGSKKYFPEHVFEQATFRFLYPGQATDLLMCSQLIESAPRSGRKQTEKWWIGSLPGFGLLVEKPTSCLTYKLAKFCTAQTIQVYHCFVGLVPEHLNPPQNLTFTSSKSLSLSLSFSLSLSSLPRSKNWPISLTSSTIFLRENSEVLHGIHKNLKSTTNVIATWIRLCVDNVATSDPKDMVMFTC